MKSYVGKTLYDALQKAQDDKHVGVHELTYSVLEEKKGLLGFGSQVTIAAYAPSDVSLFIQTYLQQFFDDVDIPISIEVLIDRDQYKIFLNADNNAIIIGKMGRTLQSLNQVVQAAVSTEFKKRYAVLVDINNYKNDRYQKLKIVAQRTALSVQRSRVTAVLDPMPNDERKLIHQELTNYQHIRTESEGVGEQRHLKIIYDETKE